MTDINNWSKVNNKRKTKKRKADETPMDVDNKVRSFFQPFQFLL